MRRRKRNLKCFHPPNEEGPCGSLECSRNGTVIWEEKQRAENSEKKKHPACLRLMFLRLRVKKPPSQDFIVISSVRWPVPREVITLNRLAGDTDLGSYRCLHACSSYSWLIPSEARFQVCEPDYWCRIKKDKLGVLWNKVEDMVHYGTWFS